MVCSPSPANKHCEQFSTSKQFQTPQNSEIKYFLTDSILTALQCVC